MAIELTDDGTMDTVLRCSECGEEFRYNFDPSDQQPDTSEWSDAERTTFEKHGIVPDAVAQADYDEFVEWAIEDATNDHECLADDAEPTEPAEDDITTTDHQTFYQNGRMVLGYRSKLPTGWYYRTPPERNWAFLTAGTHVTALRAYMERTQYWPNVWFISDHGNAHLMDLTEAK